MLSRNRILGNLIFTIFRDTILTMGLQHDSSVLIGMNAEKTVALHLSTIPKGVCKNLSSTECSLDYYEFQAVNESVV